MEEPDYNNFEIDTSDIWDYEFKRMKATGDVQRYDQMVKVIEPVIVSKCKPFLEGNDTNLNYLRKYSSDYEKHYAEREIDYFRMYGDYYEYREKCCVDLSKNNQQEFAFLFMLKLNQYKDNLARLDDFLYYQIKSNFEARLSDFMSFIISIQIQFPLFADPGINRKIELWKENFDPSVLKRTRLDYLFETPDSWETVDLGLTDEQVRAFFSFLYLEKNNRGLPFLEKEKTEKLLRFGFMIPPMPLPEKFKLNLTPQCRKSMIEKSFYLFYERYSNNLKTKQQFLKFLAYNFVDFSKYKSPTDFRNWGKNFNLKKRSIQLPFDIMNYVEKAKNA